MKRTPLRLLVPLAAALSAAAPAAAHAFCGFYVGGADAKLFNNATMVVLMREGTRTVLSMQNNYQGPPENFAMVVPVPIVLQKENVKTLPREVFQHVDTLAAPRLVEYWEQDPCPKPREEREYERGMPMPAPPMAAGAPGGAKDLGVRIEAQFSVGEYEVVVLSAQDSSGLDTWLHLNHYKIPEGAEPILRPYVAAGMKFFVAKVDSKKVRFENNQAMLSPLRFHYDTDTFTLPVRLGLLNSAGTQDLIVHILSRGKRYEVSNYPNVTIPTNYDVAENAKDRFGEFYAALFDRTLEQNPGAVVTEYSWDAASCDPCPTPPLEPSDIATLGADALVPAQPEAPPPPTDPRLTAAVTIGDVTSGNKVENASQVVAGLRGSFQQCYVAELHTTANPKGSFKVSAKLDRGGAVAEVKTTADKGLPLGLISCVVDRVRQSRFAQPKGGAATVEFPLTFDLTQGPPGTGWMPPRPPPSVNPFGFTLTRLHARYGKSFLGQDLVFKEAGGIVGGREDFGAKTQEHGAKPESGNNFQGRYIIRHPWTGPIACDKPQRGVWGGPPEGVNTDSRPKAALNTAFAPRGQIQLASFLREEIPELKIAAPSPLPPVSGNPGPAVAPGTRGCGSCSIDGAGGALLPTSVAALLALLFHSRRRRRGE